MLVLFSTNSSNCNERVEIWSKSETALPRSIRHVIAFCTWGDIHRRWKDGDQVTIIMSMITLDNIFKCNQIRFRYEFIYWKHQRRDGDGVMPRWVRTVVLLLIHSAADHKLASGECLPWSCLGIQVVILLCHESQSQSV